MIGGMISSTLLTLIVIPAIYALVKGARLDKDDSANPSPSLAPPVASRTVPELAD
jgi:Cu(I)/Ag(I) efflux system membrane protein CusA/SilA